MRAWDEEAYIFSSVLQMPKEVVWPITWERADSVREEKIQLRSVCSCFFQRMYSGLTVTVEVPFSATIVFVGQEFVPSINPLRS